MELALNSLVLGPSPFFCFKLSYNDFDFYLIIFHSIDRPFLQQSCTQIKAAFSICDKKVFCKKCKVFIPAGFIAVMTSWIFFSFYNGLHSGFIYLEMAIIGSCRLQSVGHIGQFNFLCNVMTLLLGSTSSITSGTSYESHVVILSLWYCTEHDKNMWKPGEITFYRNM